MPLPPPNQKPDPSNANTPRMNQRTSDIGVVEQAPKLLGRNIQMTLMPKPKARQGGAPKPAAPVN